MTFQRELDEAQAYLRSNKLTDRRKALDTFTQLLNNNNVIELINKNNPVSWNDLLQDTQNCLKKECDRVADTVSKKGPLKSPDKNVDLSVELMLLIVKTAIKEDMIGDDDGKIDLSLLIKYIEGCMRERNMKICRDGFMTMLKGSVLRNPQCLGHLEPEDFILLLNLLQSEFNKASESDFVKIFDCYTLLIKYGPLSALPPNILREQFAFMSKTCQSLTERSSRILQEEVVEIDLIFLKHVVEDNRLSCAKLGEEIFPNLFNLYWVSSFDSALKMNVVEISLLQVVIHHPNGAGENDSLALASNWPNWKSCIKKMYYLLIKEIGRYLDRPVKNSMFFDPEISTSFESLFVEVCKQIFNETESSADYSVSEGSNMDTQAQKRRKVEASIGSFITEIEDTKSWIWIKLVGALVNKYPQLISKKLYLNLLQILHTLQLEVKDSKTISHIYETQSILIDIESRLGISCEETDIVALWKLVGESTLRAFGLNQNPKETQRLLQKLIARDLVDVESIIQTFISGVLTITEYHLPTLQLILGHIQLSQCELPKKDELFNNLLSSQNVKEYDCFLNKDYAEILVVLTLKQCPEFQKTYEKDSPDFYKTVIDLYARNTLDSQFLLNYEKIVSDAANTSTRFFNVDKEAVNMLIKKIKLFVRRSLTEPLERLLCIVGLLYNVLNSMIDYQILQLVEIDNHEILILIRSILESDSVLSVNKYATHSDKMLQEFLKVIKVLDELFSVKNNITSIVKEAFPMKFLEQLVKVLNYFQYVAENRAKLEHTVKKALTKALSKYCLVSEAVTPTKWQISIMKSFSTPDYDFKNDTDYDLSMAFLQNIKRANTGFISKEIIENILQCLHGLCSAKYRSHLCAIDIISVLGDLYGHLQHLSEVESHECRKSAVNLLYPFYLRLSYYGPNVSVALLNAIEQLYKVDLTGKYSMWSDKEVIEHVPTLLASDFQKVRYRAVEVLVNFLKISSGTTKLETIHLLEELFQLIYDENIKVFEVEGNLTEERRYDEIMCRASSALYTFLSIIVNCSNTWTEDSLFAIVKLEYNKQLFNISDGELIKRVFVALKQHFHSENFIKQYVEKILIRWINLGYSINDFQYRILGHANKTELYTQHFDICLPLLLKKDRNDLFAVAKQLGMNEKDVCERCCMKIFGQALSSNIKKLDDNFIQNNVELAYFSQVLGSRFQEILIENIDQVVLCVIAAVADQNAIENKLGETVWFSSKGISCSDFQIGLRYIQNFLCNGNALIVFLSEKKSSKIQQILLDLECNIYNATPDQQLKCFHHYTIFLDLILEAINDEFRLLSFFLRDSIYFLLQLATSIAKNIKLSKAVLRYYSSFLNNILPRKTNEFEQFVIFTVNTLKNLSTENRHLSTLCIGILELIIISNGPSLQTAIAKLDAFSHTAEFEKLRKAQDSIKYANKKLSVEDEIRSFLEYNDIATRKDSLIHLKHVLSKQKVQLKLLYDNLKHIRGFSEDCEQSLLHKLTSMLIKMSCYPNHHISLGAIKCLGELGPANLTTIVLEPEKRVLDIKCTPFELLTGHVVSLLVQYIVDPDIKVVRTASVALYEILQFKEGKKVVDFDVGYGLIDKKFITPYMENHHKTTSLVKINFETFSASLDNVDLWCPAAPTNSDQWITSLVLAFLNSFDYRCYLQKMHEICNVKVKFCENILPLLIYLMLSLDNNTVTTVLSKHINMFFAKHWNVTSKSLIPANKKSVKCMLDVINFIRQQPSISDKIGKLKLDYLPIAKAAEFCSAHFSALLFAELWCQEKIASIERQKPRDGTLFENGVNLLDYIYENVTDEIGITLHKILQSAYKSIGDLDALSGCGISLLLQPEHRVDYYKNTGQWGHVMNYYVMHPLSNQDSNSSSLIQSFKMNQLYQLPLLSDNLSTEPQYECMWRLGQWNLNKKEYFKRNETNYEKYKFHSLKALCDNDSYTYSTSKDHLTVCIIESLKHTSLESSKNLYPIFSKLQSLIEMDDCLKAVDNNTFDDMLNKWGQQDDIIRGNDFQFVEPIAAQRMTLLREYTKKDSQLKKAYVDMGLNFADYAKEEFHIRAAENAIINIRTVPNLGGAVENELQFREAQLAWMNGDKLIAQQLLRKLCKIEEISPRLKASCLKLQGEYMAETYSDRSTILNSFKASIQIYKNLQDNLTTDDCKNLKDTYDKLATFADKEYQQIMSHIKSDLFEKKRSNIKSCKEMARAMMNNLRKKTDDEKKAQVINQKQIRIDEAEIEMTLDEKNSVLKLALEFKLAHNVNLDEIVSLCPKNVTGADFYRICASAWSSAAKRLIQQMEQDKTLLTNISHDNVEVDTNDFTQAIKNVKASISEEDLKYFDNLKKEYYMKNLSACDTNNIKIFRVISLFLENRDNGDLGKLLTYMTNKIPSYKFVTMLPQLIPHISNNQPDLFSQHINQIIEKCAIDHPHHTLPLLLALVNANKDKEYSNSKTKSSTNDRTQTAIAIIKKLGKKAELRGIIEKMLKVSEALIELAYYVDPISISSGNRRTEFKIPSKLKIRSVNDYGEILVPTFTLPVSKNNRYDEIVGISNFSPTFKTVGGINAPKRIECRCTKGNKHSQLVKGQDDLRQDAVMQQVFNIMTNLLSVNKQTKSLVIRTYKIVPLSMRSGILEWVENSMPIGDYLVGDKDNIGAHREFRPHDRTPNDCRAKFKNCHGKAAEEKLAVYNDICKNFQPVFHKFFETHFKQPSVWYERKRAYVHSVATTSMCGYVLGIGDRHVSNILIDRQTAEVIHIDFGIAFEQGKCLPTPEPVPFRLSRDIVDGMGVSGIEGLFRKSCEKTMEVLRSNSQTILTILEVLLYDPLYFWTVSAAEAKKRQTEEGNYKSDSDELEDENKNVSAQRALLRLRQKLQGCEEGKSSSVEQQVGALIQQAMDPVNLCRLFNGWQPYL